MRVETLSKRVILLAILLIFCSVAGTFAQESSDVLDLSEGIGNPEELIEGVQESLSGGSTQNTGLNQEEDERVLPKSQVSERFMAIPSRSFAKITLVHGIVTPAVPAGSGLYPSLVTFSGPIITPENKELSIMLKRCHLSGNTIGNVATQRVFVTISEISCIKENGEVWSYPPPDYEGPTSIGYLFGRHDMDNAPDSYYGIDAKMVSDEGYLIAIKSMFDVAGDYFNAVAQAQVEETPSDFGDAAQNVTGNEQRYLTGHALGNQVFQNLSSMIEKMLQAALPYFYVPAGHEAMVLFTQRIDVTEFVKL